MSVSAPVRFVVVWAAIAAVWGVVLPWVGRRAPVEKHVAAMEARGVNPAAMFYTELDRLPVRPRWVEERLILWP